MDMQADIKWIQTQVETVKDPSLIDMLKRLIQYGKSHIENENKLFLTEYNESIDRSIAQIEAGNFYTHEEMKEKFTQWQNNK